MFKLYARTLGRIALEATAESQAKNNCPSFVEFDSNNYIDIVRKKLLVEVSYSANNYQSVSSIFVFYICSFGRRGLGFRKSFLEE